MATPAYVKLKKLSKTDPPRLSILKIRYNRAAVRLNGFYEILSEEEIKKAQTELTYYQQQIDSYE